MQVSGSIGLSTANAKPRMQGKGIADQDRNILSNQTLILGFFRSAAHFLVRGPVPKLTPSRKRKRKGGNFRDREDCDSDYESLDSSVEQLPSRGTILVTLRNVPPYTQW
jgi:25S rRNA (uracil2634-N3)-methyltransferase